MAKDNNEIILLREQMDSLKEELSRLKKEKETDALTGLLKYRAFLRDLSEKINLIDKDKKLLYMYIDISNFKFFNETSGYEQGDILLKQMGHVISIYSEEVISAGRIHSDNFIMVSLHDAKVADEILISDCINKNRKYAKEFQERFNNYGISFNAGITIVNASDKDFLSAIENANFARKQAKKTRKELVVFNKEMVNLQVKNLQLISEFKKAIADGEFKIYYQPKIDSVSLNVVGGEALIRWIKPDKRVIRPDEFIPLFERNGYIITLDYYVFDQVFKYIRKRMDNGKMVVPISMNVSRLHMENNNIISHIKYLLNKYRIDTKYIEFELTENIYLSELENTLNFINEVHKFGIKVSMDDFGSGYSSLNVLSNLPIDIVKIDKVFMKNGMLSESDKVIIECVMSMTKRLKMISVCEGVETLLQSRYLGSIGCDILQGFYFSKPLEEEDFSNYLDMNIDNKAESLVFSMNGSLYDDNEEYQFSTIGENIEFRDDIIASRKVLYLPGGETTDGILKIENLPYLSRDFSISIWFKEEVRNIWTSLFYADYSNSFISIMPTAWNNQTVYRIKEKNVNGGFFDITNTIPVNGEWANIVITYNVDRKISSLYVNGMLSGSVEIENIPLILNHLYIGGDIFQKSFKGYIGEIRIYNKTLNSFNIENNYIQKKNSYGIDMDKQDLDICIQLENIIEDIKKNVYLDNEYAKDLFEKNIFIADNCKSQEKKIHFYIMYIKFKILINDMENVSELLDKTELSLINSNLNEDIKNSLFSDLYNMYGVYYASVNNHLKAIEYYRVAEIYAITCKDEEKRVVLLNNMGALYNIIGDTNSAFEKFKLIEEIEENNDHKYVKGLELINISDMYLFKEDYIEAERYIEKAFNVLRENQNYDDIGSCYSVAALLYEKTNRDELALEYYEKAYQMDNRFVNGVDFEITRNNMISFFIKHNYFDKANVLIEEIYNGDRKYASYKNLLYLFEMGVELSKKENDLEKELKYLLKYHDTMEEYWKEVNKENTDCIENILFAEILKKDNEELKFKSQKDELTGLGNRYRLEDKGERIIRNAAETSKRIGIMIIDIDRFKEINDSFGHLYGDKCIIKTSKIIKNAVEKNHIYRFGGDEFIVILEDTNPKQMKDYILRMRKELKEENKVTISIGGIDFIPDYSNGIYDYIRIADSLLYKAKINRNDYYLKSLQDGGLD